MKIGRNDPCPCGSGKKYKKCCLDKDDFERREEMKADLAPVLKWVYQNGELTKPFNSFVEKYFPDKSVIADELEFGMLQEAFIFEHKTVPYGKTPFEIYLEKAKILPSDREAYEKLLDNTFSAFEILEVEIDKGLKLYDVMNDKTYYVKEKKGTHGAVVGSLVTCRIAKVDDSFRIIGPGCHVWSSETVYELKRVVNLKMGCKKISAFDILNIVLKKDLPETLDEIKNALKKKLKSLGIEINLNELDKKVNEATTPDKAFPEILNFGFPSNKDFEETVELINRLWNSYPRKEFNRETPEERSDYGPKESMLLHSLFEEGTAKINPYDYPSEKEAERAFEEFKQKWLYKPQKELDGKTPVGVILEERAVLGNPRKDVSISLQIRKVPDFDADKAEELYFDAISAEKQGDSEKSVEILKKVVEMYPENYKAWGNMGASYVSLGKKEESLRALRKSLSVNPKYEIAKKNLKIVENLSEKELMRTSKERKILRSFFLKKIEFKPRRYNRSQKKEL